MRAPNSDTMSYKRYQCEGENQDGRKVAIEALKQNANGTRRKQARHDVLGENRLGESIEARGLEMNA